MKTIRELLSQWFSSSCDIISFQIDGVDIWLKNLTLWDEHSLLFFNPGPKNKTVSLQLSDIGFTYILGYAFRDVLNHRELGHREILSPYRVLGPWKGGPLDLRLPKRII